MSFYHNSVGPLAVNEIIQTRVATVKVLITEPKKIIQDTTYNVRRESEFICTLMEKSAYWRLH